MFLNDVPPLEEEAEEVGGGVEEEAEEEEEPAVVADTGVTGGRPADTAISGGTTSWLRTRPRFPFCHVTEIPLPGGGGGISFSWPAIGGAGGDAAAGVGSGTEVAAGLTGGVAGALLAVGIGGGPAAGVAPDCGSDAPHARQNRAVALLCCCPQLGQNFILKIFAAVCRNRRKNGR